MRCNLCGSEETEIVIRTKVLIKYDGEFLRCKTCGFIFAKNPTWLKDAYKDPINVSDMGYVLRNYYLARRSLLILSVLFDRKKTFLNYAAGYGIFVRLMRDYGMDFLWSDLYTPNLFAIGHEYQNEPIEGVTCFECFEHFVDSAKEIESLIKISPHIFFSTRLMPDPLPSLDWEYYGFSHGQHISFYTKKSLEFFAQQHGLRLYSDGKNIHLLTNKSINRVVFRVLLYISRLPFEIVLKRIFGSKTVKDHKEMIQGKE